MTKTRKIIFTTLMAALLGTGAAVHAAMPDGAGRGDRELLPLREIHDKLHLSAAQEKTWQQLADKTQALRISGREQRKEIKSQLDQELNRAQPDLARISALSDKTMDEQTAKRRALRDDWLKLYTQFSPEQKAVVKDAIKAKFARFESFREKIRQHRESKNAS